MKNYAKTTGTLFLSLCGLTIVIPLYNLLINSFKPAAEAARFSLSLPEVWRITANYSELIVKASIAAALKNSVLISTCSVGLVVLLAVSAAYGIQRRGGVVNNSLYSLLLLGMIIPAPVINIFMTTSRLGLNRGLSGVILVLAVVNLPVAVFMFTGFLKSIPKGLDEAALIDGCSPVQILFRIIMPLLKPVTVTVIIITFIAVWNDFNVSVYYLSNPKKYTLVITSLLFAGQKASDWNLVFADVVVTCIPLIILYGALQKQIISGMTAGAVKG